MFALKLKVDAKTCWVMGNWRGRDGKRTFSFFTHLSLKAIGAPFSLSHLDRQFLNFGIDKKGGTHAKIFDLIKCKKANLK